MNIYDVFFVYDIEHRAPRARKDSILRVSEVFPVEIAEISSSEAPVAIIKREVGQPDFLYRSVNGRLFRPALEQDARGAAAIDAVSFTQHIKAAQRESGRFTIGYDDNPFSTGINMHKTLPRIKNQIGDVRRDDRELAVAEVNKRALDVAFIDGAPWRIASEPVIALSRGIGFGDGSHAAAYQSSAKLVTGEFCPLAHAFRIDRHSEAVAFLHEHLLSHAAGEIAVNNQWEKACARHRGETMRGIPSFEIIAPEILNFDEAACCKAHISDGLPHLLMELPMGDFNNLPFAAMEAWTDLRRFGQSMESDLIGMREALGRLAKALPQEVTYQSNEPLFYLRMNTIDICQRIDFLHTYTPSPDLNDGLNSLRA